MQVVKSHRDGELIKRFYLGLNEDGTPMTADDRRAAAKEIMKSRNLKVGPWASKAGVRNSLYNFLNGESHSLLQATIEKLVRALDFDPAALTETQTSPDKIKTGSITVRGDLSAGTWREAIEWDEAEHFATDLPVHSRWFGKAYGLKIIGRSMNEKWPDGTIVVCVPFMDYGFELESGEDYVVVHRRNQLGLTEATAKRWEIHGNEIWLCPESTDESYQVVKIPRVLDDEACQAGMDDIYIHAVILGGYAATRAGRR